MPLILTKILAWSFIASLAFRVMGAMGLGYMAFYGTDQVIDRIIAEMMDVQNNFASNIGWLLHMTGISTIMQWIVSTYGIIVSINATRAILNGLTMNPSAAGIALRPL